MDNFVGYHMVEIINNTYIYYVFNEHPNHMVHNILEIR